VKGLGLFTVAYTAPQKKRGEEGWFYAPPVQSIVWRARCGKDDTLHLVLNGMHLEAGEAERVSWALGRVFSRAGKKRLDLHLAGFGVFGSVGKGYGFTADEGIISILNSDYEGLKGDAIIVCRPLRHSKNCCSFCVCACLFGYGGVLLFPCRVQRSGFEARVASTLPIRVGRQHGQGGSGTRSASCCGPGAS